MAECIGLGIGVALVVLWGGQMYDTQMSGLEYFLAWCGHYIAMAFFAAFLGCIGMGAAELIADRLSDKIRRRYFDRQKDFDKL